MESAEQSVVVENPFTCATLPVSNQFVSNSSPAQGTNVNFGFRLANNLAKDINVTGISLAPSSISQGFSLVGAILPVTPIVPSGGYQDFTGTVTVPSSTGSKTISVSITYKPTSADCAGSQPTCNNMVETQIISINVVPGAKPNYIVTLPAQIIGTVGQQFTVNSIVTSNNGGADATAASVTNATFQGTTLQHPIASGLQVGGTESWQPAFTCPSTPGNYTLYAMADSTNQIAESDESDNTNHVNVSCNPAPPVLKPDYVVELPASVTGTSGQPFTVQVVTRNNGTAAGGTNSVTSATFRGSTQSMTVPSLSPGGINTWQVTFNCPTVTVPTAYLLSAKADANDDIDESNENNNLAATTVTCNPPQQILCSLAFTNHASAFKPGETGIVQASCTQGGSTVSCPALSWTQNASGGSMYPPSTVANPQSSTLSISTSASTPQTGAVAASNSTLSVSCSLPFSVQQDTTPASCSLALSASSLTPGSVATATATCYNAQSQAVGCPVLSWSQNAQGGGRAD